MNNIMCDLETLATEENAAIISIGLVYFDIDKQTLGDELYIKLSLDAIYEQIGKDRLLSLNTLVWWMQQSDAVRDVWSDSDNKANNDEVISMINSFLKKSEGKIKLWGNGVTFDNMILRSYFKTFNYTPPWHFTGDMCYRTIKTLLGYKANLQRIGTQHNALDDAKTQALHLIQMLNN